MLEVARRRGVYRTLRIADVSNTGLPAAAYDLCVQSLADEHLPDLRPLYRGGGPRHRGAGGSFDPGRFHPYFTDGGNYHPLKYELSAGRFRCNPGFVHLPSDHVKAAHAAGWSLRELDEGLIDDAWLRKKPKWAGYFESPVSFAMVWRLG